MGARSCGRRSFELRERSFGLGKRIERSRAAHARIVFSLRSAGAKNRGGARAGNGGETRASETGGALIALGFRSSAAISEGEIQASAVTQKGYKRVTAGLLHAGSARVTTAEPCSNPFESERAEPVLPGSTEAQGRGLRPFGYKRVTAGL